MFCGENGDILRENDTITFPKLAETYSRIADGGPDEFYTGQVAQDLVRDLQALGTVFLLMLFL